MTTDQGFAGADPYIVPAEGGTWHWQAEGARWDWAPDAQPAGPDRPNVQHVGMRDDAGIARIESKNQAEAAAVSKAQADPSSLSYEEVLRLPDSMLLPMMAAGKFAHVGLPARRGKGRQR
jgi:hypothetical protein